jgi:hypothetical protein
MLMPITPRSERRSTEGVVTARGTFGAELTRINFDRLSLCRSEETLPRVAYPALDPKLFERILVAIHQNCIACVVRGIYLWFTIGLRTMQREHAGKRHAHLQRGRSS